MSTTIPIVVPMRLSSTTQVYAMTVEDDVGAYEMSVQTTVTPIAGHHYAGTVDVTPSSTIQTLATAGMVVDADIVIEAIPNNYGLITWDGSALTVS